MAVKMRMSWKRWEQMVLGRYIDMDGAYGAQCWDLWAHYAVNVWGAPLLSTYTAPTGSYAYLAGSLSTQFPAREGIDTYFRRLGPDNEIRRGDALIFGSNRIYPDTHVTIAAANASRDAQSLDCISQNDGGAAAARGATRRGWFARAGLIGILRPRAAPAESATSPSGGNPMAIEYKRSDARAGSKGGRKLAPNQSFYLCEDKGRDSNYTNIAGGIGLTTFVTNIYVEGTPGDSVDVVLVWINPTNGTRSQHFVGSVDIGPRGRAYGAIPALHPLVADDRVACQVSGPSSNKAPVTVHLLATKAGLLK